MLIVFILLGLCLGSFFYAMISVEETGRTKRCDKISFCGKHVISGLVMGAVGAMIYFCICNLEPYYVLIAGITLFVLGFECISDMECMHTYTLPIYIASVVVILIKTIHGIENGIPLVLMYGAIILFGICCYCISVLASRQLGAGDLDICFLIFLTQPGFAAILFMSTIVIFLRHSLTKPVKYNNSIIQEQTILSNKIPFVPFLLLGYVIAIIFSGVM